jgi:hypothetical protein
VALVSWRQLRAGIRLRSGSWSGHADSLSVAAAVLILADEADFSGAAANLSAPALGAGGAAATLVPGASGFAGFAFPALSESKRRQDEPGQPTGHDLPCTPSRHGFRKRTAEFVKKVHTLLL